jgi:hypothetical protein
MPERLAREGGRADDDRSRGHDRCARASPRMQNDWEHAHGGVGLPLPSMQRSGITAILALNHVEPVKSLSKADGLRYHQQIA